MLDIVQNSSILNSFLCRSCRNARQLTLINDCRAGIPNPAQFSPSKGRVA
ncbi:MAG: hypothetical protein ACKVIX_07315 [Sphingomonadales bacterium]